MCTTCGCGQDEARIEGVPEDRRHDVHRHADGTVHAHPHPPEGGAHWHRLDDGSWHEHVHEHGHGHEHAHARALSGGLGAVHAHGVPTSRIVAVERDILAKNNALAEANRRLFADRGMFVLNLVSSPGSGKTTLLVRTIAALAGRVPVAVIEGDQQTTRDADRIRATGVPAVQINTGKGCHLDAQMVGDAVAALPRERGGLLFIENVGNLVCPAAFDLGEAHKVVILSVTEGEDKPLKYPDMFHAADLLLINKVDLAPHVEFDAEAAIGYARQVRPGMPAMRVSATTGEGLEAWIEWLLQGAAAATAAGEQSVEALRRRVAELESELARRAPGAPGA
jgi:hydrogenase nickel incorporation protein HypB